MDTIARTVNNSYYIQILNQSIDQLDRICDSGLSKPIKVA